MANQALFASAPPGPNSPKTTARNDAGGLAYARDNESALAQLALTGTFNDTFYASAQLQYERVLHLAQLVDTTFLAKLTVYARENGQMKDTPAFLLAVLSVRDPALFRKVFDRVITHGKILRNFVQFIRSGQVGRKSLGSSPKKAIKAWLNKRSLHRLLSDSIGNSPSLADVVKLTHPRGDEAHNAFYKWLVKGDGAPLPQIADYQAFVELLKDNETQKQALEKLDVAANPPGLIPGAEVKQPPFITDALLYTPLPQVPFEMLTSLALPTAKWIELSNQMSWSQLRQSLNTLARNGVFENQAVVDRVAARLADPKEVADSRAFPYQLYNTALNTGALPKAIAEALDQALLLSLANVPFINKRALLAVDVSGSMRDPVTGQRKGATTTMRNVDVAALFAAAFLRTIKEAALLAFDERSFDGAKLGLNTTSTIMDNARVLSSINGGGTNVAIPLAVLNSNPGYFPMPEDAVIIMISDNESWSRGNTTGYAGRAGGRTQLLLEWRHFRKTHPKAKMVCIDISPNTTLQVPDEPGVINIGGYGDNVFKMVAEFLSDERTAKSLADHVNAVELI
jgi:60 kDa SS-A/Ro ribonucleoprotein